MKNVITFLMCSLSIITGMAQTDLTGNSIVIPERTPELNALYQQSKDLEQSGTAAEINANIIAIKNAWQAIDPNVAALYKPIVTNKLPETVENLPINGVYIPTETFERDGAGYTPEDWGTDKLLMDDWVDGGVDMDVTLNGDIYISSFQNDIENEGATFDEIIIFRSTDGGNNFSEWQRVNVTAPMRKLQIISMDGDGDDYLLAYILTATNNFQVWRWNIASGDFAAQVIAGDVTDFGVDRNYPTATASQRCFATYQKTTACTEVHSARSTSGSYGFDWLDEVTLGICGQQIEFSYGLDGGCYVTFTGATSGNLYGSANPIFNDPASWEPNETVANGGSMETLNPTIRATRKDFSTDEVLIIASSRNAGSSDSYIGQAHLRESGAAYAPVAYISAGSDANIMHIDTWMRKVNSDEVLETAYVRDDIDNSSNDLNRSFQYDGSVFGPFEEVNDSGIDVFDGFGSAVAETNDELPCLAFAGTSGGGGFGYGLYFDAKTVLSVEENTLEGFKFYPNPTNEVLNLSAKNTIEKVSVYSILGQIVLESAPNKNDAVVNVAALKPGIYILKLAVDGQSASYKFIKQ